MTKALLLLAWVPLLSVSTPRVVATSNVAVTCDTAMELMDIVKNDDVVTQRVEDRLLLELRKDFIKVCN
jgi:hypothetical protein